MSGSGFAARRASASRPLRAMTIEPPSGSSTLDSAKMLRTSSSTTRMRRPSNAASRARASRSMRCRSGGSFSSTWCRNRLTSSSRRSGDFAPLMMIEREYLRSCCSSSAEIAAPGVDDDGRERVRVVGRHAFQQFVARRVGQRRGRAPCSRTWWRAAARARPRRCRRRRFVWCRCRAAGRRSRAAARCLRRRARCAARSRSASLRAGERAQQAHRDRPA